MRAMSATLKAMHESKLNMKIIQCHQSAGYSSARVGEFVKVIQEVVEQTNLLSLNASIIAAQAGERGKGLCRRAER